MTNHNWLLILGLGLCAFLSYDITRTLRTGKARGRFGTIMRAKRPDAFRRYVIADVVGLAVCLGIVAWGIWGR